VPGGSVESDRNWARNRIAQFTRGNELARAETAINDGIAEAHHPRRETPGAWRERLAGARVMRKAAGGAEAAEHAQVSQPGEPAEREADAVADHVAEKLHGEGKEGERPVEAGKEAAPAIGAKLDPGKIHLAGKDPLRAGTRNALGAGPTTGAMHEGNAAQAGVTRTPRHHVFPQEHRAWFAEHGVDIDQYCIEQGAGEHSALHTMGWNAIMMDELLTAEKRTKQKLKPGDILGIGRQVLARFGLGGVKFVPFKDK
jgi:hypothetical protein